MSIIYTNNERTGFEGTMVNETLVSIQTPVFNQAPYIEETIRSVLDQTYQKWEWIIIDDGSTDRTKDIIRSFPDKRIRYYYQEHAGIDGICNIHNQALGLSQGDFIAFIDGDDLWPEYKLEQQVKSFLNDDIVLSYGECCLIDSNRKKIDYIRIPSNKNIAGNNPVGTALQEFLLKANSFIYNPTIMVRKSALEKIGGFIMFEGLAHDFTTWFTLAMEGTFQPLPFCLGYWRRHNKSLTFHHAEYRFRRKTAFIREFLDRDGGDIALPGFCCSKGEVERSLSLRVQEYLHSFYYDRAMLLAAMGMFGEAQEAFGNFLVQNQSGKNHLVNFLFYLSGMVRHDLVNPVRKLKKKLLV